MKLRLPLVFALLATLAGAAYLAGIDYGERLETDVSSLLPDDGRPETGILRSLISEKQGKVVYLVVEHPAASEQDAMRIRSMVADKWRQDPGIGAVTPLGEESSYEFLEIAAENRLPLFLPKWIARKRAEFEKEGLGEAEFEAWLSDTTLEELDAFFESPLAFELGRPETLDPLLLLVRAAQGLEATESPLVAQSGNERSLFWVELADSPMSPEVQRALAALAEATEAEVQRLDPAAELRYGGLARLAAASRARIHRDIGKVNGLSLFAVVALSLLLVRPPWRLVLVFPVVVVAFVGASVGSFLVFDRVNVVVIIIGSVLIGTSIDYAFHSLFAGSGESAARTRKLLLIGCASTVVGFATLVFSNMALVRQIGVFVGFGLLSAYLAARLMTRGSGEGEAPRLLRKIALPKGIGLSLLCAAILLALGGLLLPPGIQWREDIRNLEAPDEEALQADLQLRKQFGEGGSGQAVFFFGDRVTDALSSQARFLEKAFRPEDEAAPFAASRLLPTREDVDAFMEMRERLPALLDSIEGELLGAGYDAGAFAAFFEEADRFLSEADESAVNEALGGLSEALTGPMALALGRSRGLSWTVSTVEDGPEVRAALESEGNAFRLSQLVLLNESLEQLRSRIALFGSVGMVLVVLSILWIFGFRRGAAVVSLPVLGVCLALTLGRLLVGELNLFSLIGCFLGAAIGLDYALFGLDALWRGRAIPYSVWLSAATTGSSFLALTTSYIAGVRSLGFVVAAVTLATLVLIVCYHSVFGKRMQCSDNEES